MSLQGTLDTFSLPEILELVEKSRKTGALEVRDPQSRGVLYFAGGRFSAAEAGELCGPVESAEELEARLIDVCFALFRVETGLFEFESDRFPPWPVRGGSEVAPIVEQVQQLRRDWLAIEAVLPSLDCRPGVVDDLDGDRVVLNKAGFRVLRVVDGDRNVREIARAVGRSVLEVCKVLKDLVDAGAVVVPTDPARTMVDELVLTADAAVEAPPVLEHVAETHVDPVTAAFPESEIAADSLERSDAMPGHAEPGCAEPEHASPEDVETDDWRRGSTEAELPELPEVPGLVVPSSPEGLTDVDFPAEPLAEPDTPEEEGPAPRDYAAEAREAEQSGEAPAPVWVDDEPPEVIDEDGRDDDEDDDEPAPDRGALLRMFSSLRDT
ncbi:MAG: DUF4388 domain-containing protein [Acidimicrobiia bacterium]